MRIFILIAFFALSLPLSEKAVLRCTLTAREQTHMELHLPAPVLGKVGPGVGAMI